MRCVATFQSTNWPAFRRSEAIVNPASVDPTAVLAGRLPNHSLPREAYLDPAMFEADLARVWTKEWILAGVEAAIPEVGMFERVRVGQFDLLLVRAGDGAVLALHNVCRHRGFVLCDQPDGLIRNRIVCPYHQWAYHLDGTVARARSMPADFDATNYALGRAHCQTVGGMIFVCLAEVPPDFIPFRELVEPYLEPYDLSSALVAKRTVGIERGNWKLVMENNRECFHCRVSHPELCATFPEAPLHAGNASSDEAAQMNAMVDSWERSGLPSRFSAASDAAFRVMRMPLHDSAQSMTLDGEPAVSRRFASLPEGNVGDVLLYHYPSTWMHLQADHCLVFRITPVAPALTELVTYWLVPPGSEAGIHYDMSNLTQVWDATNAQDTALVERAHAGILSPAYRPGPYSPSEETGVIQFIDWYVHRMSTAR